MVTDQIGARKAPIREGATMGSSALGPLTIRSDRRNGVARVALGGELDLFTVPAMEAHLLLLEREGVRGVILDLRDLTFVDSTGLRGLLVASGRAGENGHRLAIVGLTEATRNLFKLTGTERILNEPAGLELLELFTGGSARGALPNEEHEDADRG